MRNNIIIRTKEKNYLIQIKINSIKNKLKKIIKNEDKVFIIIDKKVDHLIKDLSDKKNLFIIRVVGSEKIKNYIFFQKITEKLLSKGIDRKSCIISIGGGTVGDISGFIASTVLRGVKFILIPTTLLSQVDSSIGGKNGINSMYGKNLIGTFYQPNLVIIDPYILMTLPIKELKSGYAEIIKHALIYDSIFFKWLENNYNKIFNLNFNTLEKAINKSILIKSKFVQKDTKEKLINNYSRAILNFGHTFGHALETFYQYKKKLTHGEAIAIGMMIASKISNKFNYLSKNDLIKINNHFKKVGLPTSDKNMYNIAIFSLIKKDKKNTGKNINLVLLKKIGKAKYSRNLDIKKIKKIIY